MGHARKIRFAVAALAVTGLAACTSPLQHYRDLGIAQYNKDDYSQSLASLNKALSYDESDPAANTYAGLIHYRAGEYEQALYHFKVALQLDPSSEKAKNGITATLIKLGKPDLALDYLERAAALAMKVKDPRLEKSEVKRPYLKQTEEKLYLSKASDRVRIAKTYEALGDYDNALAYYQKALQFSPNDGTILLQIARLYEKTGNTAGVREYLARAYRAAPQTPGLTDEMTKNGLAISDVLPVPVVKPPLVPAPSPPPSSAAPANGPAPEPAPSSTATP
ncbi:MAG TPA: tetratricopeptide repeat protein [Phycisphaerae bacterium]|nr:tetratricopeptide repeat protein [Phycisphaerae bacterium]